MFCEFFLRFFIGFFFFFHPFILSFLVFIYSDCLILSSKYLYRSGSLVPLLPEKANWHRKWYHLRQDWATSKCCCWDNQGISVNQAWAVAYLSYRFTTSVVSFPASVTNFS